MALNSQAINVTGGSACSDRKANEEDGCELAYDRILAGIAHAMKLPLATRKSTVAEA